MYGGIATDWNVGGYEAKRWYRMPQGGQRSTTDSLDEVQVSAAPQDLSVFPGQAATVQFIERFQERKRLAAAVDLFRTLGYDLGHGATTKISEATRLAAKKVLKALPDNVPLPTVAPDGETGVIFHWNLAGKEVVVTVDDHLLHCVERAGTPDADYFDDIAFDGDELPEDIFTALQ